MPSSSSPVDKQLLANDLQQGRGRLPNHNAGVQRKVTRALPVHKRDEAQAQAEDEADHEVDEAEYDQAGEYDAQWGAEEYEPEEEEDELDDEDDDEDEDGDSDSGDDEADCDEAEEDEGVKQVAEQKAEAKKGQQPASTVVDAIRVSPSSSRERYSEQTASRAAVHRVEAARSSLTVVVDAGEDEEENDDEDEMQAESEEVQDAIVISSDCSDDSDSGSGVSQDSAFWDGLASHHEFASEYARGSRHNAVAMSALCGSVDGLSYHVSNVAPVLSHINTSLNRLSTQQLQALGARSTASTSRWAELGWPAATMSLLTVLLMLMLPLWLPWAIEKQE